MLTNYYKVETSPDFQTFEFVSKGRKGNETKVVRYSEINVKGFYNLGFGDKDPITGFLSDLSVTNNGTAKKCWQLLLQHFTPLPTSIPMLR